MTFWRGRPTRAARFAALPGVASSCEQPRADRVQRGGRRGRVLDDLDVLHGAIVALTRIFVKLRFLPMRIVLAGGTGQIGRVLTRAFADDEVVVIARSAGVRWDGRTVGPWASALEGADAVINLAGRSVDCRYTPANRAEIMDSRLLATRALVEAIQRCAVPPRVFLSSSTATIYADNYGPAWDESGRLGGAEPGLPDTWRFSIDVARRWEEAAAGAGVRTVLLRSAMVMSPDRGGVFDTLYGLVRRGLGGRAWHGRQYVSWIHETDFAASIRLADRARRRRRR